MTLQNLVVAVVSALLVSPAAVSASAQTAVAIQQQFFGDHSDGSTGPDSFPCCNQAVTTMTTGGATVVLTPPGTYDTRTIPQRGGAYFAEFDRKKQYGTANVAPGGTVTIPTGLFTTAKTLMLVNPGGNLAALTTSLMRTVGAQSYANGGGIAAAHINAGDITAPAPFDFWEYSAFANRPTNTPTFRTAGTWAGPNPNHAGRFRVTPSANQYGGTRNIVWQQFSAGFNIVSATTFAQFVFPVQYGPGAYFPATFGYNLTPTFSSAQSTFMASDVVKRSTAEANFTLRTAPTPSAMTIFPGIGTGWFTFVDFTTGTVQILANTIGTSIANFSTRTEVGYNTLMTTTMGGITGQLQLVSGGLLQSRQLGGNATNLAHSINTLVKFAPEPASASLIAAGALGLIGLAVRDRRRGQI
jgi:hypothetical protein